MIPTSAHQPRLFTDCDMSQSETHPIAGGLATVYSARSPIKESPNEDVAALLPLDEHLGVLVVADGAGGARGGRVASHIAVETLKTSLAEASSSGEPLRAAILDGIERTNQAVMDLGVGAATTLAVVEIDGELARPYHVGDSAILVFGQRGKVKLQTISHSPVGFAIEAGVLDEEEAIYHEDRHLVSNVVGTPDMRIEVGSAIALAPRDTLLLASDGLFDNLHLREIVDRMRKGPLEQSTAQLIADAQQRMAEPRQTEPSKPDDLTIIAFRRRQSRGSLQLRPSAP